MEYCYSGTESLWYGSWNRHVCRKGKCAADRPPPPRSTGVNPRRKQSCCSPSCLWSQAQWDTSDLDNFPNLGWLTIGHRCICMWSWTETTCSRLTTGNWLSFLLYGLPMQHRFGLVVVGCIEDFRRFSGVSAISRLGSRRLPVSEIQVARPGIEPRTSCKPHRFRI